MVSFESFESLMEAELKKRREYLKMDVKELMMLSNEDLRVALSERLIVEEEKNGWEADECLRSFKGAKKAYYVVNRFDMEVLNGGLCQFFVNLSRKLAPYVAQSLNTIGALEYEKLLSSFVEDNKIDLNDLDSFIVEETDDYAAQTKRYPFDNFDDKYCELYKKESLDDILIAYAKKNIADFENY